MTNESGGEYEDTYMYTRACVAIFISYTLCVLRGMFLAVLLAQWIVLFTGENAWLDT